MGAEWGRSGRRSADPSHPSLEGLAATANSPGPPAAPGSPWPQLWAAALASWLSSLAARAGAHFLAGTSDSGTVTWQRSHFTGARSSPNWRKGKRQQWGGGRGAREGKTSCTRQAPLFRIPPSATADPLTPHSPHPPPPQSLESLGDQTPASIKLVERGTASEQHLTALQRRRAAPEVPGSHSTAVCAPRPPSGSPRRAQRARWSSRASRSSIS